MVRLILEILYASVAGFGSWALSSYALNLHLVAQYFIAGSFGYAVATLLRLYIERTE